MKTVRLYQHVWVCLVESVKQMKEGTILGSSMLPEQPTPACTTDPTSPCDTRIKLQRPGTAKESRSATNQE